MDIPDEATFPGANEALAAANLPSDLAFVVTAAVRKTHEDCEVTSCALSRIWAEDVQEILDLAKELA